MKRSILASCVSIGVAAAGAWAHSPPDARADKTAVAMLEITGTPAEKPGPLAWLAGDEHPTLRTLVTALGAAARRDDLRGVVIRLRDAQLKTSHVEELGGAIRALRDAGKKVHVFAEAYDTPGLLLGSFADEVIVQSGGEVSLPGVYMEEMFLADTLAWAGITANMVQVGDYKGASEQLARTGPSPQWDQNISQLLDGMYANIRATLKRGRGLSDEQLDRAMEKAWMATGGEAKGVRLVDSEVDLATLSDHLARSYNGPVAWVYDLVSDGPAKPDLSNPLTLLSKLMEKPSHEPTRPTIALVPIDGAIVDGDSKGQGLFGGGEVGSRTVRNALEEIRSKDLIKGVILRIDSPGGSAIASEVIWQGVRRVAEKKPVWVSVGSMAASGGYYIAVSGDRIYVNPSSVVGSIGVVGGKMALGGLYAKLKVHVVGRGRGPMAGMFASAQPWTPEQVTLVRQKMTETYDLFTRRVAAGRKGIDLTQTAEGRLFTGDRAIDLKMADAVGGLRTALDDMARELHLATYDVMDFPGPKGLGEMLEDVFGGLAMGPGAPGDGTATARAGPVLAGEMVTLLREAMGPRAWQSVRDSLGAFVQLRDHPVLLVMPRVIIVR
jgi:protease IV